jgi:hypothetical protein
MGQVAVTLEDCIWQGRPPVYLFAGLLSRQKQDGGLFGRGFRSVFVVEP